MDSEQIKKVALRPIKITIGEFDEIEKRIKALFKREIYLPILKELSETTGILKNAKDDLKTAIQSGRIQFSRGKFKGKFNASISKELKGLGAKWEDGSWKISNRDLPLDVRMAISSSETIFQEKMGTIDQKLRKILPEEIADRLQISKLFDSTLFKVDREFHKTARGLVVPPILTKERRQKIADEWQNNMKLWIKDFTEKEIKSLRKDMQTSVFAGNRYESAIQGIQKSYGVSVDKAKFLARQETNLLITTFKQQRYEESGIESYRWACVTGSAIHPVRPSHKKLEGKIFNWDDPPITTEPGTPTRRNHPGQDYNCRCFAIPIVKFKKEKNE